MFQLVSAEHLCCRGGGAHGLTRSLGAGGLGPVLCRGRNQGTGKHTPSFHRSPCGGRHLHPPEGRRVESLRMSLCVCMHVACAAHVRVRVFVRPAPGTEAQVSFWRLTGQYQVGPQNPASDLLLNVVRLGGCLPAAGCGLCPSAGTPLSKPTASVLCRAGLPHRGTCKLKKKQLSAWFFHTKKSLR